MKKGEVFEGIVETILFPNKGIVPVGSEQVTVKNTIPGQKVRFQINKKKAGRFEARLLETTAPSPMETEEPGCSLFSVCGSCLYRKLPYAQQLKIKEEQVRRLLEPVLSAYSHSSGVCKGAEGQTETEPCDSGKRLWNNVFEGILGSPLETAYRNKMEYSFGNSEKDGPLTLGLHKRGSTYDVLPAVDCRIVHEDFNRIVACVQELARKSGQPFYHKRTHRGYFRHLLVRRAEKTGEILVGLVTTSEWKEEGSFHKELTDALIRLPLDGQIVGILHILNDSVADVVQSDRTDILYGRDHFYEEILGLRFKITPFSFFQTNSPGMEVLYGKTREFLGDVRNRTVFDLYSGTGTIAQILAPVAGKVIGVEIVEEAVQAARENAAQNGLENCTFLAGDVLKVIDSVTERPDVIVLDPPRGGIHPKALPKLTAFGADRIVYISCKPTSLAEDLPYFLQAGYSVQRICCVDMFPAVPHVETVCLLSKLSEAKKQGMRTVEISI